MLKKKEAWIVIAIVVVVVVIAAWSRLRYTNREGYDNPGRWKVGEYQSLHRSERVSR